MKSSLEPGVTSGQIQLFPTKGYTAETYAKVMGGSPPSQPRIKPEYTLLFCSWIEVAGWFLTPIGYTISRRYAAVFFGCCSAPEKLVPCPCWISPDILKTKTTLRRLPGGGLVLVF